MPRIISGAAPIGKCEILLHPHIPRPTILPSWKIRAKVYAGEIPRLSKDFLDRVKDVVNNMPEHERKELADAFKLSTDADIGDGISRALEAMSWSFFTFSYKGWNIYAISNVPLENLIEEEPTRFGLKKVIRGFFVKEPLKVIVPKKEKEWIRERIAELKRLGRPVDIRQLRAEYRRLGMPNKKTAVFFFVPAPLTRMKELMMSANILTRLTPVVKLLAITMPEISADIAAVPVLKGSVQALAHQIATSEAEMVKVVAQSLKAETKAWEAERASAFKAVPTNIPESYSQPPTKITTVRRESSSPGIIQRIGGKISASTIAVLFGSVLTVVGIYIYYSTSDWLLVATGLFPLGAGIFLRAMGR